MARKTTNATANTIVEKATPAKVENTNLLTQLQSYENIILEAYEKQEGLAERIAHALYNIDAQKLYKEVGFTSIAAYADSRFGIAKGTTSEAINTFKRFGNKLTGNIDDKYKAYKFSALIVMKQLSDAEIEAFDITPDKSRAWIKEKIANKKLEEKSRKQLLDDIKKGSEEVKEAIANTGKTAEEITKLVKDATGLDINKLNQDKQEVKSARLAVEAVNNGAENADQIKAYIEASADEYKRDTVVLEAYRYFEGESLNWDALTKDIAEYAERLRNNSVEIKLVFKA